MIFFIHFIIYPPSYENTIMAKSFHSIGKYRITLVPESLKRISKEVHLLTETKQ